MISALTTARSLLGSFFHPWGTRALYLEFCYLAAAFPLGLAYFVFLATGIGGGAGLIVVWIGVPILLGMVLSWRRLGRFERHLHRTLLSVTVDEPSEVRSTDGSMLERVRLLLVDASTWRTLLWLLLRLPLGVGVFVALVSSLAVGAALVGFGAGALFGFELSWVAFDWDRTVGSIDERLALPAGILILLIVPHLIRVMAWAHAVAGQALLSPSTKARERVLRARTATLEQRNRLAGDLHDAVGHTVTLITVQAGAGRKVFDSDPDFARSALTTIERQGRLALEELDRILGLLHDAEDTTSTPGLAQIPALVDQVNRAGLAATLDVTGQPRPLSRELETTAYRIVQEALTNTIRHAGSVPTAIRIEYDETALVVEVVDDGPPGPSDTVERSGRGLTGIRERAAAFDGEVAIGPRSDGGFAVHVRFPTDPVR